LVATSCSELCSRHPLSLQVPLAHSSTNPETIPYKKTTKTKPTAACCPIKAIKELPLPTITGTSVGLLCPFKA